MPKAFSESEKQLIRERLLEQGYKQFSTFGLRKVNIEELARAAGISKGAFYIFYDSKETLFMDVIEQVEERVRREILTIVDLPGPSPRARLFAILKGAFTLFKTTPLLQVFTGNDFDVLLRRVPPKKFQEHLASDGVFFTQLLDRCRNAGIPIMAPPDQISSLAYQLVLAILHEDDLSRNNFGNGIDLLLELIAAYCLGEVEIQLQKKENENEPGH